MSEEHAAEAKPAAPTATPNSVAYGTYKQQVVAQGKTVGQLKDFISKMHNIPDDAQPYVNFQKVSSDYEIKEGDNITFHRPAGDKG